MDDVNIEPQCTTTRLHI